MGSTSFAKDGPTKKLIYALKNFKKTILTLRNKIKI